MLKRLLIVLLFQPIILIAVAQTDLEFIVTPYSEINDISTKGVSDILQGSAGYIWIASYEGLIRFDGSSFKTYINLPDYSNSILKIAEDKNKNIWLALSDGTLAKFDPINASFCNINIKFPKQNSPEKPGGVECIFFDSDNNLWLGITRTGLVKVDVTNGNATVFNVVAETDNYFSPEIKKFYNRVLSIYEGENKVFWLATPDGLYTFDKVTHQMIHISQRPALGSKEFRNDNFRCIIHLKNKLWLAALGGGISSFDLNTKKFETFKFVKNQLFETTDNIVHSIIAQNDSILLIASLDKGFLSFNTITHTFTSYGNNPKFKDSHSKLWTKLLFDKDKNIWAFDEFGIMKIQLPDYRFKFQSFPIKHSDNQQYYELIDVFDNKDIRLVAINYSDGLQVLNKKTGIKKTLPIEKMKSEPKVSIFVKIKKDNNGNIWVLSRDYIYQYDIKKDRLIKLVQPPTYQNKTSNYFSDVTFDQSGNAWFGTTRNGMFCYNIQLKKYIEYSSQKDSVHQIPTNLISSIISDNQCRIWFSSNRGLLSYYNSKTNRIQSEESINHIKDGLYGQKVFDLFLDSKNFMWVSIKSGLVKIDCNYPEPKFVKKYTTADGLHSEFVVGLAEDAEGKIWGIEKNIYAVCMIDEKKSRVVNYGLHDGINHSGEIFRFIKSSNSRLWLMAQGGYYECDPYLKDISDKNQLLVITAMTVNSVEKQFEEEIQKHKKINLEPDENSFSFEFAAIDFSRPDIYQFSYMLEGFDTGWINCGNRRSVSFTNIPGGNYIFKVRTTTSKREWGDHYVSLPLFLKTPFYKKWWFSGIIIFLIFLGFYFFYHFRMKKQKQISLLETKAHALGKEKSQIQYENIKQQLNPHFLFNSLTSLSSLIRVDQKLAIQFLGGMSKIYRYILQSKDEELIDLDEEIKFIQTFIQLQKTRFENGLLVNIDVDAAYRHKKIVPVTLQNLIENSIKHNIITEKKPLIIDIYTESDYLIIRNNLQKKKFVESSNQQGLNNLVSLYHYYSEKPLFIHESGEFFIVKIPLI